MLRKGFNVLIDGQWGSTGKGKVAAFIALNNTIDIAVSDFQANAGHTTVFDDGRKFVVHQLPTSAMNEDTLVCVNPAATINLDRILKEIDMFNLDESRLKIDGNACIIQEEHVNKEKIGSDMVRISSTLQGVGEALSQKVARRSGVMLARDVDKLRPFIACTSAIINEGLASGATVLAETAQGFDLSINHGRKYPFVTSRDITVGSTLNNCGVSPIWLSEVIGVLRTFPIRVGNVVVNGELVGYSGEYYEDQKELTWEELTEACGADVLLQEKTTVTQKVRRIFTFSEKQFMKFYVMNMPTQLAITFIDYLDYALHGATQLNRHEVIKNFAVGEFLNNITLLANKWLYHITTSTSMRRISPLRTTYLGTGEKMSQCCYTAESF